MSTGGYFRFAEMFWYGEYSEMNFQSSGLSGSPYSAIQEAPASSRWYRFMSSSGTSQTSAPNFSGLMSGPFASVAAAAPLYGYYYCERMSHCLVGVIPY